ncbi:MAG: hypothetical protein J6S14_16135 [Clostridia bacterium]|nr:hypothetical protein [Clostridia bacterium]
MNSPKTVEVILRLKAVKEAKGLSVAEIVRRVNASGSFVSETVVYRIFAKDSEKKDSFIYSQSIEPVAKVMLTGEETSAKEDALIAIVGVKNEQLAERDAKVAAMKEQYERRCAEYDSRLAFLRNQIATKDKYMNRKDAIIQALLSKTFGIEFDTDDD